MSLNDILYDHERMYQDEPPEGCNSPTSPSNLRYARTHEELSGRRDCPIDTGCSIKERLETRDYWNWD